MFGNRSIEGALTGTPGAGEDTLRFSELTGVMPMVETFHMMSGKARFRVVLTMGAA